MPIYMDVHIVPGVKAKNVAEAHRLDVMHQSEFGCQCMTYWIDEQRESIFCLIEAPDKAAVEEMHSKAHGLIPNKVIEVSSGLVESFLGRIYDPQDAEKTDDGLKVFAEASYRVILVTRTTDPVLLKHQVGKEKTLALLEEQANIIRHNIATYGGAEVEYIGRGFLISFTSASKAVSCALAIQREIPRENADATGFRIGIHGGEPVEKSDHLFGDCIQMANYLSSIAKNCQVALSSPVRQLVSEDILSKDPESLVSLSSTDEELLQAIFIILEKHWQDPEFDVPQFCGALAMSKSQLYRKVIALTGLAPNLLLKDFRLEKAKELLSKRRYSISQITFDSGFTSPSYFTKCFKKNYGMLPMEYIEMLH